MRTIDEIYEALVADLVAAGGVTPPAGGDMALRLRAVAAEILSLEAQADFVTRQCFPQSAVGEYLDRHAEVRGLERGAAQKAGGPLRFWLEAEREDDTPVPAGTVCMTAGGTDFVTTEDAVIPAGALYCETPAEAAKGGSDGNVAAGAVAYMRMAPAAVSGVTNPSAFSGGTDGESDAELRARVLASYRKLPNGANAAYYENKVLSCPNVEAVTVMPRARGRGTVDVTFATYGGVPEQEEVDAVQAMLDSEREICVDIDVFAPDTVEVDVEAALTIADGYAYSGVAEAAEAALRAYFSGARLSKPVYRAALCALLMAVDGVENCALAAPAADVAVSEKALPVLGTVRLREEQRKEK